MPLILLIEDNPANLELMRYLLEAFGYTPRAAGDGKAGLAALDREDFDLILCDIQMPVMDGYEVARQLEADPARCSIPLVAVTALAMVGDRDKVLAAGFDGYITKPIDPHSFVRQVEEFLHPEQRQNIVPKFASLGGPAPPPTTHHTILVVDNLAVNLELARSILEPHGYQVLTAGGIDQGLALAREHPIDLILSDVCMAGGNGYDFIRAVKADPQLRDIPFVFNTSTMVNEHARVTGLALGAARFLFRPIEPEQFLAEIETCLLAASKV